MEKLDFSTELQLARNDRRAAEWLNANSLEHRAETIYYRFCAFCKMNGKEPNETEFRQFVILVQKDEFARMFVDKLWFEDLNVKKLIFEKWFGYEFKFDGKEWIANKKGAND